MPERLDSNAIACTVNGRARRLGSGGGAFLVDVLRDELGLTGTNVGCDTAQCGACTVHLDGVAVKACTLLAGQVEGREITTIEGLATGAALHPVQEAFRDSHALQCGFCTPGMVMNAVDLLAGGNPLSDESIRAGLKGNLCRCTGYQNIVRAIASCARPSEAHPGLRASDTGGRIGEPQRRSEDARFLMGRGRYTANLSLPGQAHAVFVRSPHAFARIRSIKTDEAIAVPGIVGVLTGEDVAGDGLGKLGCGWMVRSKDGSLMRGGERPILAHGHVRYVGEAVAIVVGETREIAAQAAALVDVAYERLASVVDPMLARGSDALHEAAPRNICFDWEIGDAGALQWALAEAAHVTEIELTNNRLVPNALEPRAAIGSHDRSSDEYLLYTTSQNPHLARKVISETVGPGDEHRLRVISPDVGGGFGSKIIVYPEECACLWASRRFGVPVKWVATRTESFLTDTHGRDHRTSAKLALDKEGRILGLSVQTVANLGAYLSGFGAFVPSFLYGTMLAGPYRTPVVHCEVQGVFTNTAPVDAYRGAGRPEATFLVETIIDEAAREMGIDPVDLRRRNLIRADEFPFQTPVALEYDVGDYAAHLDLALAKADHAGFAARKAEAAARGKLRGIGVSCYVEACGIGPSAVAGILGADVGLWESATLRFTPSGKLVVLTGSHSHGQGHETSFAQLVADKFGIPFTDISIVHGDTGIVPMGMGTYGSRSLVVGGSAILKAADKVIAKGRRIAAHLLMVPVEEIAFRDGQFHAGERNRSCTLKEVVQAAYKAHDYPADLEPGLEETAFYDPGNFTYPSGTHVCEIEIDPETGETRIVRFTAVDDFGMVINPMIVEGQVHGGIAQGVGQALLEEALYDPHTGDLVTASLREYALPRASDLPVFDLGSTVTVCTHNPVGAKGCGEAGAIGAPPAVMNAIRDAIGVRVAMPARPERVWKALQQSVAE